jgi:hypothetical protein
MQNNTREQLLLQPDALWIGDEFHQAEPDMTPEQLHCAQIDQFNPGNRRWQVVILDESASKLKASQLIPLISSLRDIHARRTIVLLGPASSVQKKELIALGFHAMPGYPQIYYHDLMDYKQTPDWLNNHYWANPENWNRFRW